MPVNGLISKLGLITLGVKKEVFTEIGYFHCTTKASDDEFFQRACKFLGKTQIQDNALPLYYNTYRDGSLFADMATLTNTGEIIQKPSESRQHYLEKFTEVHNKFNTTEKIKRIFRFPQIRNSISVMEDMTKLPNPKDQVIFNVCSIPARVNALKKTINSIIDQCDLINIYLDGYKETPEFLLRYHNKCNVTHSKPENSLRDNGKFLALERYLKANSEAYYFTIDDDIIYPPDYTNHLIKKIEQFNRAACVGVHGVILKDHPKGYFSERRIVYSFTKALEKDKIVNILGTGTIAFHTSAVSKFNINNYQHTGMVDILFGLYCKQENIIQIAVARPEQWLTDLNPTPEQTLYHEFKDNDSKQARYIQENLPWGYLAIENSLNNNKVLKTQDLATKLKSVTKAN